MHVSKADLEPTVIGEVYQTLEPVQLIEFSPVEEHDRTMAVIARNMGAVVTG